MAKDSEYQAHETLPWRDVEGFDKPGIQEKILYRDEKQGTYVRLLKIAPGFQTGDTPLKHDFDEFVWVLQGYAVNPRTGHQNATGMHAVFPAGLEHGPFFYPEGAVFLEFRHYAKK
jgi:hypothetical protein